MKKIIVLSPTNTEETPAKKGYCSELEDTDMSVDDADFIADLNKLRAEWAKKSDRAVTSKN